MPIISFYQNSILPMVKSELSWLAHYWIYKEHEDKDLVSKYTEAFVMQMAGANTLPSVPYFTVKARQRNSLRKVITGKPEPN